MATAKMTQLSVPTTGNPVNQGLLMPKLKYRFRVTFDGFGISTTDTIELTKQVIDIKRPSVNFNPITIDVYNSKVYLQGKPEWQETTVNLRDDAAGNVARLVGEQVQKQFDFLEQASAASGIDYKFILRYEVLDGSNGVQPQILETWEMFGCQISQVDYGDLNYSTNDPATIALTIRFDNAIQSPTGVGVGTAVGRTIAGAITG